MTVVSMAGVACRWVSLMLGESEAQRADMHGPVIRVGETETHDESLVVGTHLQPVWWW